MPKTVETRVGVCYNDFKYCTKGETGMLISLVVPCYNEEESLPIFYKEASKIAQQMGISHGADFEFIFVDAGSKDRTLQIARELHRKDARVRYISFSRKNEDPEGRGCDGNSFGVCISFVFRFHF